MSLHLSAESKKQTNKQKLIKNGLTDREDNLVADGVVGTPENGAEG